MAILINLLSSLALCAYPWGSFWKWSSVLIPLVPSLNERFVEEEIQHRMILGQFRRFLAVGVLSPNPSTPSWLWELPSPGILCVAVVDILRYSIIFKEVCELPLEVWSESLHQARPWEGIENHGVASGGGECFNNFHQTLFLLRVCLLCTFNFIIVAEGICESFGKLQMTTNERQLVTKEFLTV